MSKLVLEEKNEELPKGWISVTLPDIVKNEKHAIKRGPFGSHLKKSFFVKSGYKVYEQQHAINNNFGLGNYYINEQKFQELKAFEVKNSDLIISCSGTIGKIARIPKNFQKGIINQALLKISINTDIFLIPLFSYLFEFWMKKAEIESHGSGMGNLSSVKVLKKLPILLPPLNEQKRIVAKIDETFSELENIKIILENVKLKLKQYSELLLKHASEGKLSNLQKLDVSHWINVSYRDICTKITYGFTNPMPDSETGFWKITATNIKNGKINYETARKTDYESFHNKITSKSRPKKNTVLITKDGTLGNVAIVDKDNICINQSVASLEPILEKILPEFLVLSLQRPFVKKLIQQFKRATTIAHISITDLATWELLLPSLNEQKIIINKIKYFQTLIEKNENTVNSILKQLDVVKSSILKQAFEGKLIPQDPNDEPAEILLEKIEQEKERLILKEKQEKKQLKLKSKTKRGKKK